MPKGRVLTVAKYKRARGNLLRNVREAEKSGAIYERDSIPTVPERVTMQDVREMQRLNKRENRYKNETWISPVTGEEISGTEYRAKSNKSKRDFMSPVADTTYVDRVQDRLNEAIEWVDSGANPNHITPAHMNLIVGIWENSLSWLDEDYPEIAEELNAYLKLNMGLITNAFDIVCFESEGNDGNEVQSHYEFLSELLDWSPA